MHPFRGGMSALDVGSKGLGGSSVLARKCRLLTETDKMFAVCSHFYVGTSAQLTYL